MKERGVSISDKIKDGKPKRSVENAINTRGVCVCVCVHIYIYKSLKDGSRKGSAS